MSALQIALGASKRPLARLVSGRARNAIGMAMMPSGTLTANSHGQGATDRIPDATVGPTADAIEPMVAFSPTPRPIMRRG